MSNIGTVFVFVKESGENEYIDWIVDQNIGEWKPYIDIELWLENKESLEPEVVVG